MQLGINETLNVTSGATVKEVNELTTQTQFAAMLAKQITNEAVTAVGPRNFAGGLIGEPTRKCVESVSRF